MNKVETKSSEDHTHQLTLEGFLISSFLRRFFKNWPEIAQNYPVFYRKQGQHPDFDKFAKHSLN